MRRTLLPVVLFLVAGCQAIGAPGAPLIAIPAVVEAASLRAFGRTTGDSIVSLFTGEDCSIARIGRGEAYCGRDDAPAPPPMCTRSLGAVDCWTVPPAAWPPYRGVANGPSALTEAQENNRIGWARRIVRALEPTPAPPVEPPQAVLVAGSGVPAPPQSGAAAAEAAARSLIPDPGPSMGIGLGGN
ncbi:hypothetical protein AAFN86_00440 [Roseomonas sp. CAU 1739]|uniref:hypothetical protein n=1 Tax=Roseomonas sp. CAU 1739 TaxID=3140364 RepID=UPI00325C26C0